MPFFHCLILIFPFVTGPYQPSTSTKLKFYSLFKQATEGPCNAPQPPFYNITARTKWTVWNALRDMSREEAMTLYIREFKKDVSKYPEFASEFFKCMTKDMGSKIYISA